METERHHKVGHVLQWTVRSLALLALAISIYLTLQRQFWIGVLGGTGPVTVGAVSTLFLLSEYSFSLKGVGRVEATVMAILFSNAFVQSYELIYHFTFPVYLNYFRPPFLRGEDVRHLMVTGSMILPLLLVRRHLSFKKVGIAILALFILVWAVWILYGFPQYHAEGYFYPPLIRTSDPWNLSLLLNFGSKVVLATFFVSFLSPRLWSSSRISALRRALDMGRVQ